MTHEEFLARYKYDYSADLLGEGGFGEVFKAYDTYRDRWVAIKVSKVRPELEAVRLKKEVEMVSRLPAHPNIAFYEDCYTFREMSGEYDFGILQYYEHGNLQQLLQRENLTEAQKHSLLRQILAGIGFLHANGIIHRDLKPQNILIVKRGSEYIPKITDFGISKQLDVNRSSVFNNSLAGAGTLAYSSPEQLGDREIRKNTDLWSYGVIVFQTLTGALPFTTGEHAATGESGRLELFRQISGGTLPERINSIPEPWRTLISRCLNTAPEQRIKDVAACSRILDGENEDGAPKPANVPPPVTRIDAPPAAVQEQPTRPNIPQPAPEPAPVSGKKRKSKRWIMLAAGAVIVAIPCVIVLMLILKYDRIREITGGLIHVELNGKHGYVNIIGKEVIPLKYDYAKVFDEGLASVQLNGKWGYIDKTGKEVIPFKNYENVQSFGEGFAAVKSNGKWGYIDKTGKEVIPLKYDGAVFFTEGFATVQLNGKWGFIDKTGNVVIPLIYDVAHFFKNGRSQVNLNGKEFYIDKTGKCVKDCPESSTTQDNANTTQQTTTANTANSKKYDYKDDFYEGLAKVKLNGKYGYIDRNGKEIIPLKYDDAAIFDLRGLARVKLNGKYGFINRTGNEIIPLKYDNADHFFDKVALVTLNGKKFYIDETGKCVADCP